MAFKVGNKINKGRIPWNKGVTHTPETRKKISEIRKAKGTSAAQLEVLQHMAKSNIGRIKSVETREKLRRANKGKVCPPETRLKISQSLMGKPSGTKGMKRTQEQKERIRLSLVGRPSPRRGVKNPKQSGVSHWNWRGGITTANETARKSIEAKLWRKTVFERDGFTCVKGGKEHGNKLHADHIKPFALYPELRFEINNGRTLCEECHLKTETYAGRTRHAKQLIVI